MLGYYNKPAETAEVFDKDNWFHTGDIGKFEKGYLKITDRKKNMLKTSLGKNIYPTPIENTYLKSDYIEQVFLIGDQKEYVTAIIVPTEEFLSSQLEVTADFFEEDGWIEEEDLHKIVQAIQSGFSILPGFGHDFITGVTAGQVTLVNQFFLVAGVVIKRGLGQANATRDITQGRGPGSLKIK